MDVSQKNIDMSREAVEIQALWLPQDGDYYYGPLCMPGWGCGIGEVEDSVVIMKNVFVIDDNGDDVRVTNTEWAMFSMGLGDWWSGNIPRDKCTWLPTQDQIQAISPAEYSMNLIDFFDTFLVEHAYKEIQGQFIPKTEWQSMSMEQLWLAFVMDEEFNKHWNGITWENNNEQKTTEAESNKCATMRKGWM